jgi:tryptophanyl-tRNA synthetase
MSKSRQNTLDVFADDKTLKNLINKNIVTDALALEDPKDPASNPIHQLYSLVAGEAAAHEMAEKLKAGGYGWGHAKTALREALTERFANERERYYALMADKSQIDDALATGAAKAREVARDVLDRVREKLGMGMPKLR